MNAYDFDGTIYDGDSTTDFYRYCLVRTPGMLLSLPDNALDGVKFMCKTLERQTFKERFMRRLVRHVDVKRMVDGFWRSNRKRIKQWYLAQRDPSDLVISASPQFLLEPICQELGVDLIATDVDPATGTFLGPNMRDEQKVRAFRKAYPNTTPAEFYSDSMCDAPMMRIAKRAFLVRGSTITPVDRTELTNGL